MLHPRRTIHMLLRSRRPMMKQTREPTPEGLTDGIGGSQLTDQKENTPGRHAIPFNSLLNKSRKATTYKSFGHVHAVGPRVPPGANLRSQTRELWLMPYTTTRARITNSRSIHNDHQQTRGKESQESAFPT